MAMNTKLGSEACGSRPAMLFTLAYKREKLNYQRTTLATCRISLENPNNVLGFFLKAHKRTLILTCGFWISIILKTKIMYVHSYRCSTIPIRVISSQI